MKAKFTSFKTANGTKVFSNNAELTNKYMISEEGLNMAIEISRNPSQTMGVWELLSHKVMYISYAQDEVNKKDYVTLKVFLVKTKSGELKVWSNHYLFIENNDVIFTELAEAKALTEKHQEYEALVALRELLSQGICELTEEIDKVATELDK